MFNIISLQGNQWLSFGPHGEKVHFGSGECGLLYTEVAGGFTDNSR